MKMFHDQGVASHSQSGVAMIATRNPTAVALIVGMFLAHRARVCRLHRMHLNFVPDKSDCEEMALKI